MVGQYPEPKSVVPICFVPEPKAWRPYDASNSSDLFPRDYRRGVRDQMGNYAQGTLPPSNPLFGIFMALRTSEYQLAAAAVGDPAVAENPTYEPVFRAVALEWQLAAAIGRSFDHLIAVGHVPETATERIEAYINGTYQEVSGGYQARLQQLGEDLDRLCGDEADPLAFDRGDRIAGIEQKIEVLHARQLHLGFEWLSATALNNMLVPPLQGNTPSAVV